MRHEEATDSAVAESMETPSPPNGLMALRHSTRSLSDLLADRALELSGTIALTTTELTKRSAALAEQTDRIANYVQALPTRDDFDALIAENESLRQRLDAIESVLQDWQRRRVA